MAQDLLFSEKRDEIRDFDFGKDTAVVFDETRSLEKRGKTTSFIYVLWQ